MRLSLSLAAALLGLWIAADTARAAHPATLSPGYWAKQQAAARHRLEQTRRTLHLIDRNLRQSRIVRGAGRDAVWLASLVVWGPIYGPGAFRVARCESGTSGWTQAYNPNGGYAGAWQMGPAERRRWGHGPDALAQARAAHAYWTVVGWGAWQCQP